MEPITFLAVYFRKKPKAKTGKKVIPFKDGFLVVTGEIYKTYFKK